MKTPWTVLIAVIVMFAQVFAGVAPAMLLLDPANPLRPVLGAVGVTLTGLLLVYLVRRFLDRRPWRALGWSRPSGVLTGVLAGAVPVLAANGLALALGAATWVRVDASAYALMPLAAVVILLNQAFPEELLWRGHVYDSLSTRLSPAVLVAVVSAGFGVLHIVSQSPARTLVERLLFVVTAIALGFACTAARARHGGLWMAVGVHLGFHLGMRLLPLRPEHYGVMLVLQTVALALAGAVLFKGVAVRGRGREGVLRSP